MVVLRMVARARPLAESRTAHAATRVHLRVCPPDLDFLQQRHEPRPFRLLSAPSGVSPRASVFRVSLFPATLCFAVFRVSEFGRGCEGPCFVFRVSGFSALVPRLRRAWPPAAPAAGSHLSGTKTSYALRGFRLRGATDVTFGGNRYCQDPICMSGRLHAWAKLVCTCKQLSRLLSST